MSQLKPWADGPFELILHAELHRRDGDDFGRRIALIGFDNAIEVAISTYLQLHPIQRQNKAYPKDDVEKWTKNYHTKLDFFFIEIGTRGLAASFEKDVCIWCHEVRNGQYHGGGPTIPRERELTEIRKASLEIFSILFDVPDVENVLNVRITELTEKNLPERTAEKDKLIDRTYGVVSIAGMDYYASEALYAVDPFAYGDVCTSLQADVSDPDALPLEED
ncbi:MAG TPA: hypothetical protein VER76_08300 [Pyrinomonadaceae bacterium]|nr:hypothetical protein [Pyrinomonadaceae bacterium]